MMGNPSSLPLPSAPGAPAPHPAPVAGPVATPARPALPGAPAGADAAPDAGVDAALLFDLLLGGGAEEAENALPALAAGGAKAKVAAPGAGSAATEAVDPLAMVLAQMPQLQPAPVAPMLPEPAPVTAGDTAAAAIPAMPLPQAMAAAQAPVPATTADVVDGLQMPAPAAPTPAMGAATNQDDGDAVPVTRFALQPDAAKPAPLVTSVALALAGDDGARPLAQPLSRNEAAVTPIIAPLHGMQAAAGSQPASTVAAPAQAPILQQPTDPASGYDDRFGGHVALLAGQRIAQAEIRVVPEHLGAIDIRLKLDGNEVRAEFHSAQPEVRQALEASLPRLRDMLGQHGLQLSHAGVGQGHGQGGQRQPGDSLPRHGQGEGLNLPHEAGSPLPPDFRRGRGLVDVYA